MRNTSMSNNASAYALAILLKILFPARILFHLLIKFFVCANAIINNWFHFVPYADDNDSTGFWLKLGDDGEDNNVNGDGVDNQPKAGLGTDTAYNNTGPNSCQYKQHIGNVISNLIGIHSIISLFSIMVFEGKLSLPPSMLY